MVSTSEIDDLVRPLEPLSREPTGLVERTGVALLRRRGPIPLRGFIRQVAYEVYRNEIRCGAWVLDLGLLGPEIFLGEVTRELRALDGVFWKILKGGSDYGVLSDLC